MSLEAPVQDYFIFASVRLTIRFDEFGVVRLVAAPTKTQQNLAGVKQDRGALVLQPDLAAQQQGIRRFLIVVDGQTQTPVAQQQARSPDGLTYDVTVIPKTASWSVNGVRTADTLGLTIKYIDCPIDPRVVRSCAVEYFMGTVPPSQYANGGAFIPDTYVDSSGKQRTNSRFQGFVHMWDVDFAENGEPIIKLECKDNTTLLELQQAPKLNLDMTKPIDEAVALYLSHYPQLQGISVEYRPNTDSPPILKNVLANTAFRPNLGPHATQGGATTSRPNVFDYLAEMVGQIGHSFYVDGTTVVITRVRSFTSSAAVRRADDPYQGRTLGTGEVLDYRRFVFGRNIKELRFSRNYGKHKTTNIEIRSYDTSRKRLIVSRFPSAAQRIKYAIPGGAQADMEWTVFRVPGITDQGTLDTIAQQAYEQVGRNELQVEVVTRNLSSFGGGNDDPDILDVKVGDSFEVMINRDEQEVGTLNRIERILSTLQGGDFLRQMGFSDDFANAYVKAVNDAGFLAQFRVRSLRVQWGENTGAEINLVGVNYIEVRMDKSLDPSSTAKEPGAGAAAGNSPKAPVLVNNMGPPLAPGTF